MTGVGGFDSVAPAQASEVLNDSEGLTGLFVHLVYSGNSLYGFLFDHIKRTSSTVDCGVDSRVD